MRKLVWLFMLTILGCSCADSVIDLNTAVVRVRLLSDSVERFAVFYRPGNDTTLPAQTPELSYLEAYKNPELIIKKDNKWNNNSDSVVIFLISVDTLAHYSWKEVQEGYKIMRRFDIDMSPKELSRLNAFCLCYPLTSNMKNIKMYPPYEEMYTPNY